MGISFQIIVVLSFSLYILICVVFFIMTPSKQVLKQLEPWYELKDKVVLVTGASSGIGREICLDLGKAGCKIIAAARRVDHLKSLCFEINTFNSTGIEAAALELDVSSDAGTIQKAVMEAWKIFGKIDALINNAGFRGNVKSSMDLSEDEWDKVFKTNLTGTWLVSKYVCILMRDAKRGGSVINISSVSGLNRSIVPGGVAYACSKGGVDTMTRTMAIELGVYKIRVNSIAPGLFKSEITQGLMEKEWLKKVTERTVPLEVQQTVDPGLTSLVRSHSRLFSIYIREYIHCRFRGFIARSANFFFSLKSEPQI